MNESVQIEECRSIHYSSPTYFQKSSVIELCFKMFAQSRNRLNLKLILRPVNTGFISSNFVCVGLWNPSINLKSKRSQTIVSSECKVISYSYTFGDNSWKTLENFPGNPCTDVGKSVSGTLNWIVSKDSVDFNKEVILSFDLVKETYREVLLPQHDGYHECYHELSVLSNCLCVCFDNSNESCWVVWMMKEYGIIESWTKLMIIPYEKLICNYLWPQPSVEPLLVSENGVVLQQITMSFQLVLYNINNGEVGYPFTFGKVASGLHIYHQSLRQWTHNLHLHLQE
ncbi:F-box associated protein [Medicago truncatula]|uniref:F-box associated protein n=1 Tax=Medicago truncatula TaxID=3880 RepID=A0A072VNM7_MEDTR|nr:F-box associated protein [Medicago truncatula]